MTYILEGQRRHRVAKLNERHDGLFEELDTERVRWKRLQRDDGVMGGAGGWVGGTGAVGEEAGWYYVPSVLRSPPSKGLPNHYIRLALKWHLDKQKGQNSSTSRFQEINEAYQVRDTRRLFSVEVKSYSFSRVEFGMEIVHIPEKPPIQPDQQPTVDVLAAPIEPKLANTLIRRLNQIAPLESLRHVKRVCKNKHLQQHFPQGQEEGKSELCVILCLASQNTNDSCSVSHDVQELITSYHLTVFKTKVCKYAATSKEEWEEQCKLWPTSFHPPTYNIDGITGFSNEESQSIFSFMNVAIQLAKSVGGLVVNAAVIVDPSIKQVISSACDQTCSWDTPPDKNITETGCCKRQEALNSNTEGRLSCKTPESNSFSDDIKELYGGVSCLFPLGWATQQPNLSSSHWHPLRHAAIVAIESSAARDRRLFPSLDEIQDESTDMNNIQSVSIGSPAKRQKTNFEKVKGEDIVDSCREKSHSPTARPYLCTGYDIYLVWEPCPMCAMALVHQRIRRIFFAFPNTNAGALGSVYRLQGEKSLNHHYAVFRVMVPDSEPLLE